MTFVRTLLSQAQWECSLQEEAECSGNLLFLNVNYPYNVVAFFKLFSVGSVNAMIPNPIELVAPAIFDEMQVGSPSPPKISGNDTDTLYLNNAGSILAGWITLYFRKNHALPFPNLGKIQ